MKEGDRNETLNRYNHRLEKFGYSEETLGWSRQKNDVRFNALVTEWRDELENSTIGDFGCGFGDLYGFLVNEKKIARFSYTGMDINENLINVGRGLYPKAQFWVGDVARDAVGQTFDFIFSSGVFNHKLPGGDEYRFIEESLQAMFGLCRKGIAVNFLSDKVDYELEHTFHSNPGKILEMVYGFSRHVVLRNDYMPFEFTIYIRKDASIDSEKIVFIQNPGP